MKNHLIAYDVIFNYGLNHEVPTDLPRDVSIIFTGVKPLIDANYKKRFSTKKKGSQESKKNASDDFDEEIGEVVQLQQKGSEAEAEL